MHSIVSFPYIIFSISTVLVSLTGCSSCTGASLLPAPEPALRRGICSARSFLKFFIPHLFHRVLFCLRARVIFFFQKEKEAHAAALQATIRSLKRASYRSRECEERKLFIANEEWGAGREEERSVENKQRNLPKPAR